MTQEYNFNLLINIAEATVNDTSYVPKINNIENDYEVTLIFCDTTLCDITITSDNVVI